MVKRSKMETKKGGGNQFFTFREYPTFQGFYKIKPSDSNHDLDYVFNKCILHVMDWLKGRIQKTNHVDYSNLTFLDNYPATKTIDVAGFDVFASADEIDTGTNGQFIINIFGIKEFGEWTIKIFEPNNEVESGQGHADRLFTTDIALKKTDNYVYLAMRTKTTESRKHRKAAAVFRPGCMYNIAGDDSLELSEGILESSVYPINIIKLNIYLNENRKKDEFDFINNLVDNPKRQLPIVFLSSSEGYDPVVCKSRIEHFSNSMSGEAYVISDEYSNGYKDLLSRMETKGLFDKAGIKGSDAKNRIKDNFMCIHPMIDGKCIIEWMQIDNRIKTYDSLNESREKIIRAERDKTRAKVGSACMNLRNNSDHPEINYGDVLFYSDLLGAYINKSDSKTVERLKNDLYQAKQEIKRITENIDASIRTAVEQEIRKIEESYEKTLKEKNDVIKILRDTISRVQSDSDRAKAFDPNVYKEKLEEEHTKQLNKLNAENKNKKLENDKLAFFVENMSIPYEKKKLLDWVRSMSDMFCFKTNKKANDDYEDLWNRMPDDYARSRLRNGFILLYAYILNKTNDPKMSEELYKIIREEKDYLKLSSVDIQPTGGDSSLCEKYYGKAASEHVVFGSKNSDFMYRIYFNFYSDTKKCEIIAVVHHAPWE